MHAALSAATMRVAQLEAQLAQGEQRILQLEEVIRAQGQHSASSVANLDEVAAEVTGLRGSLEVIRFEVDELKRSVSDAQLDQERRQLYDESRLGQVERFLGVQPPPPPADSFGTVVGSDVESMPDSAIGKLEMATEHMTGGRNDEARVLLLAAIDMHGGDSELPEIRYRYAETFFNESDWRAAANGFQRVTDNHPQSDWACWSMFRIGECFDQLGQGSGARLFYEGATEGSCSRSAAAKEARAKL
jgi:TolA-binding protein